MQAACLITTVKKEDGAPDLSTLGRRVAWARTQRKLTQQALADRVHVKQSMIGNLESGTRKRPRELLAIAKALYANPEWLETGRGEWDMARAKGAIFEEPDESEKAMLYNWRRMMDDDRTELAAEIAKRAERFQGNMEKVMRERGLLFALPEKAGAAARSAIARASVTPTKQRQLPLDAPDSKK